MPVNAKVYISVVSAAGLAAMLYAFLDPARLQDPLRLCTYVLLSMLAGTLKLRLQGLTGTMSPGFVLVLLAISKLTLSETMLLTCAAVVVQCLWRPRQRPAAVQVLFSVSAAAFSLMLAYQCSHLVRAHGGGDPVPIMLAVATCLYFLANSLLFSGVLSLVKGEPLGAIWRQCFMFAIPYYLVGGVVAAVMAVSLSSRLLYG